MRQFFQNPANRFLGLLCLYYLQGLVNINGGTLIGQLLCLLIILIGFKHLYQVVSSKNTLEIKGINILLFLFIIYGFIRLFFSHSIVIEGMYEMSSSQTFKTILLSILPIYSFYYYSVNGFCNEDFIIKWTIPMVLVAIANYSVYGSLEHMSHESQEEITNNASYFFVALLPSLMFFKNKPLIQYTLLSVLLLFVVLCMKRGAILTGSVMLVYFLYHSLKDSSGKKKIIVLVVTAGILVFAYMLVKYMMSTSDYFMFRIQQTLDGNASNREDMYPFFWKVFKESPLFIQLFGGGLDYSVVVSGNGAHNDWFEILLAQGIFGVIVYLYYWISLNRIRKSLVFDQTLFVAFSLIVLSEFIKTFFSFSINALPFYEMPVWGYCIYRASYMIQKT